MTAELTRLRLPVTQTIAIGWLALLTTVLIADHIRSKPRLQDDPTVIRAELAKLQQSLTSQAQALDTLRRLPAPLTQTNFLATQERLDARLTRIERSIDGSAAKTDIGSLQEQLTAIEARMTQMSKSSKRASAAPPIPTPPTQEVLAPPFLILGTELRGGERFLSVLPAGTAAISGVHLLRVGESEGEWLLESLDTKAAVFHVHDRTHRVELP